MSKTWKATRTSIERLRAAWRNADAGARMNFFWWLVGIAMMGSAIIGAFGWLGLQFVVGFVFWKAMLR